MPFEFFESVWRTVSEGREWRGELHNRKHNGSFFWAYTVISPVKNDAGEVTHVLLLSEDVTHQKEIQERLLHQANHDPLTGLPNRVLALDRASQAVATAREGRHVVLMIVGLSEFRRVNETLGHDVGDAVLVQAANRLRGVVRAPGTVARIGGDEFLVVLNDLASPRAAEGPAQAAARAFEEPFQVGEREVFVSVRAGPRCFRTTGRRCRTCSATPRRPCTAPTTRTPSTTGSSPPR